MKELIYKTLTTKCEAEIAEAEMSLTLCFTNPVAIGEHTHEHFAAEAIKALDKLSSAKDNLNTLKEFWGTIITIDMV
jgi:hypothetical protein